MTKIISFISRKGGSGKTTNAINLATSLYDMKKKVLLVETDPNYTLISTRKIDVFKHKLSEDKLYPIIASTDDEVATELEKLLPINAYDFIIVDSAGKTTDQGIKELCLVSDMVIITTSLTQNDLLVAYQTVKDLKPAEKLNKKLKLYILPNRIHSHTRIKTIKDTLSNLDVRMFDSFVPQKKMFTSPSTFKSERKYRPIAKMILKEL
ncbi:MAG: ParA family protein [Flavobacteriales bacterium]|nr:ParA family protein [Flavobacteriales bacterium]